jgi:alpha-beta hydrolase superfamily lysophospholipase
MRAAIQSVMIVVAFAATAACTGYKPAPSEPIGMRVTRRPLAIAKPVSTVETEFDVVAQAKKPFGTCKLRAVLAMPQGSPARALVVILHGSGPLNRDGTVGTAHIYKDLALGLAAHGYATIRFDKRAAVRGCAEKLKQSLTTDVFLSDITQVVATATARPEVKGLQLVLFGHSEGATFAAELGAQGRIAATGFVLAAGLGRYPIDATVLRQLHAARAKPGLTTADKAKIDKLLADGERFYFAVREKRARTSESFMGAYTAYWRDLMVLTDRAYQTAGKLTAPVLAIQGDRDENVARDDHLALAEATSNIAGSDARMLPGVDHLMLPEGGTRVAPAWIEAVAAWLDSITGAEAT